MYSYVHTQRINRPLCKAVNQVSTYCPNVDRVDSCVLQNHAEGHGNFARYVWCIHYFCPIWNKTAEIRQFVWRFCDTVANILWALDFLPALNGWTFRALATYCPQCSDRICKECGNVKPVRNKLWTDKKNDIDIAQHLWKCLYKAERDNWNSNDVNTQRKERKRDWVGNKKLRMENICKMKVSNNLSVGVYRWQTEMKNGCKRNAKTILRNNVVINYVHFSLQPIPESFDACLQQITQFNIAISSFWFVFNLAASD